MINNTRPNLRFALFIVISMIAFASACAPMAPADGIARASATSPTQKDVERTLAFINKASATSHRNIVSCIIPGIETGMAAGISDETMKILNDAVGISTPTNDSGTAISLSSEPGLAQLRKLHTTDAPLYPQEVLLSTLTKTQIDQIASGHGIPIGQLSQPQLAAAKSLFIKGLPHGPDGDLVANELMKSGVIGCYLGAPLGQLYQGNRPLHVTDFMARAVSISDAMPMGSARANKVWPAGLVGGETEISVSEARAFTFGEIVQRFASPHDKMVLVVSPLAQNDIVIVSAGRYSFEGLMKLALYADRSALQDKDDMVSIVPDFKTRDLRYSAEQDFSYSQSRWKLLQPVLERLEHSPRSNQLPFDSTIVDHPKLVPLSSLTAQQRTSVLTRLGYSDALAKKLPADAAIFVSPMINCEITTPVYPDFKDSVGIGMPGGHQWLTSRN